MNSEKRIRETLSEWLALAFWSEKEMREHLLRVCVDSSKEERKGNIQKIVEFVINELKQSSFEEISPIAKSFFLFSLSLCDADHVADNLLRGIMNEFV